MAYEGEEAGALFGVFSVHGAAGGYGGVGDCALMSNGLRLPLRLVLEHAGMNNLNSKPHSPDLTYVYRPPCTW